MRSLLFRVIVLLLLLIGNHRLVAQRRSILNEGNGDRSVGLNRSGQKSGNVGRTDSLARRDRFADSITIFFRFFDSTRIRTLDSSINDFNTRFPVPYYYHHLGNYGTAAQSLLFQPFMKAGFNPGFHAYDIYKYSLNNTRFYETTRPYTELTYLLGSKAEQLIEVVHTQNRKDNFNFSINYRFSNAPGNINNQNASHNNFRFVSNYRSPNRKYALSFVYIANKAASSENGGLQDVKGLDNLALNDPYELATRLGPSSFASRNPFNTTVNTGNIQKESTLFLRHSYSFGPRDSLVTDSVTYHIFYPRFRLEHTLKYSTSNFHFFDNYVDSARYQNYFNTNVPDLKPLGYQDAWKDITNEFNLLSFPDKNNLSQYLKAGMAYQYISGKFDSVITTDFYNIYAMAEYRNRTRNQIWEIEAGGKIYLNGFYSGDYEAGLAMKRLLGSKAGYLHLGVQNVNKSPAFIFNPLSRFPIVNQGVFGKENIVQFSFLYEKPNQSLKLGAHYSVMNNYVYFDSFFTAKQEATLFNVLQVSLEKKVALTRHWNWYFEAYIQQKTGQAPVNLPFLLTRNRIAFEGNFYTNLFLSTGIEIRYHTPYKADSYSPMLNQYFYQNQQTISNRPDINVFLHFRIKSFKGFIRFENLNSLNPSNGFSFSKPNLLSGLYPNTTLWTRIGVWWNFVN